MSQRVLCKFFAHGACLKGEHCEFSHDWKTSPNNVCTYYQKGACAYGSRCRYEHVKLSRSQPSAQSSAQPQQYLLSSSVSTNVAPGAGAQSAGIVPGIYTEYSASSKPTWNQNSELHDTLDNDDMIELRSVSPADRSICAFAAAGNCHRGEKCPHIHGDLCPTCGKHCLHPFRPQEREEHIKTCENRQKHIDLLKRSQEIECSVCLECVLSKSMVAERKFGILSECDHPFCISCIRNWRGSSSSGMDVNSALRACPICRKLSYFIIPSVIWYFTKEEKEKIVDSYKTKLRFIDCKHFDFGSGTCPFGTSCFYRHQYRDGRLEEVVLRHLGSEDGNTVIAKDIRLSDFLSNLEIR
uniref:Zinc finger CCCH domain-containing protein 69-like n=1 Tax=Nicotiana tabacum TaxID=4097 RepID=A0A1S4A799_TOBAC|nr:PREDICTED: zinc finger CCCH domain-containing protein 69-like [Nicotiana tabacum]